MKPWIPMSSPSNSRMSFSSALVSLETLGCLPLEGLEVWSDLLTAGAAKSEGLLVLVG